MQEGEHTPFVRLRPTFLTFLALLTDLLPDLRWIAGMASAITGARDGSLVLFLYLKGSLKRTSSLELNKKKKSTEISI